MRVCVCACVCFSINLETCRPISSLPNTVGYIYLALIDYVKIKRGFKIYPSSSPYCIFTVAKIQYHGLPGYKLDGKAKENS